MYISMIRRTFILLLAVILSLVIWWVGPLVSIGSLRPIAAIWVRAVLIAVILVWALWPWVAACLGWLASQIRAPKSTLKRSCARDRVSSRFYDAIRTLKYIGIAEQKSTWRRFCYRLSSNYLNDKPWFLIMGPAGCGKTSLINESGKRFLLSEQYGFKHTVDVGSTRDCNWWLTDKAVYIDTAGEWTQIHGLSEEANKAQGVLYSLIRRHRRHPGVDGVILCLDAAWLLHTALTERKSMADALCARMLETAGFFRNDVAVYLALNNIDSLPGGETFLAEISDEVLSQGIGFTLIFSADGQVDYGRSDTEYTRMAARISDHAQELLHNAHSAEQRQQLLFFTESVGNLRKPLFNLLEQVFPQLPVGYAGQIRQVWLGSTQVLQRAQWGGEWDMRPSGHLYAPMLDNAILERGVLSARAMPLRNRVSLTLRYVAVCALLAFSVNLMATRYLWEEEYIAYMTASFDETKRMVREIPATNRVSDDLISAYEQLGYMSAQLSSNPSPLINPYFEHGLINKEAQQTYHRHLFKFFWPAMERYVYEELGRDITANNDDVYNTLKIYLMLGKPEHRSAQELENWFSSRWSSFAPQGYSDADKRIFMLHLRTIFSESLQSQAPVTKLQPELIRLARLKAMAIPIHMRVLRGLQSRLTSGIDNVSLASAAGANASLMLRRKGQAVVTDMAVPAFYTLASYHDVFKPQLDGAVDNMIQEEAWVLRDGNGQADRLKALEFRQKLTDEVRKLYLLEYADHWEKFLKDIRVRPIASLDDAALLARQFSDPSSPLSNLLRFVTRQTNLTNTDRRNVSGWLDKRRLELENTRRDILGEISGERSHFRITPEKELEQRFEAVRRLGAQLMQTPTANNDPLARRFEEMYNQLSSLAIALRAGEVLPQNSLNNLKIAAAQQPEPVRSIMQDLLEVGNTQSLQQSSHNLNSGAASFTANVCRNVVSGRYPFNRNARDEVGIGDFSRLFGPSGAIRSYFDQHLASYVDNTAGKLQVREGSRGLLSASTLRAFENAMLIGDTFFNKGGETMAFSLYLRPLTLSSNIMEAELDIDGQVLRYSHGSTQPVSVQWPGQNGGAYVRLSFKDLNGRIESVSFNGPWALFHLYDKSNPISIDRDRQELTMGISSMNGLFKVELRSTMNDFPLWSRALNEFSCPNVKSK
ncbi:type VI secretion system membrane subunit TssM [Serratia sp. AKBS12]|uniref:type VI secretion system membrane subunit TssM n=1 Tax=Serratia sp. AKBS12 TaxID=2974597 RepID=UPI00216575F0|nr:type VI secretion system membrane subunit TssM [Serratia sp. AKBS12]MCS3408373.1 type VI secretion system membrane subunit TssM [Serratia sp. AKBS12]